MPQDISINIKRKITIAIDGFSSSGKSTLAKDLARTLNYLYIDSGAMYRAVALYCLDNEIIIEHEANVSIVLPDIKISFDHGGTKLITLLNGVDVSTQIRSPRVASIVSEIAAMSSVRKFLVAQQQALGADGGIVMDGRDISTVVFPDAELKIYVDSDIETRTLRRYKELIDAGKEVTKVEVQENLSHRDLIDSTRKDSPLTQTADARYLDNSKLSRTEQLDLAMSWAIDVISQSNEEE